jgi:hypothetical protein
MSRTTAREFPEGDADAAGDADGNAIVAKPDGRNGFGNARAPRASGSACSERRAAHQLLEPLA